MRKLCVDQTTNISHLKSLLSRLDVQLHEVLCKNSVVQFEQILLACSRSNHSVTFTVLMISAMPLTINKRATVPQGRTYLLQDRKPAVLTRAVISGAAIY